MLAILRRFRRLWGVVESKVVCFSEDLSSAATVRGKETAVASETEGYSATAENAIIHLLELVGAKTTEQPTTKVIGLVLQSTPVNDYALTWLALASTPSGSPCTPKPPRCSPS